jgi:hypothetical protein
VEGRKFSLRPTVADMKKLCLCVFIGIAVVLLSGCQSSKVKNVVLDANYRSYDNFDALSEKANLVVQGEVVGSKFEMLDISTESSSADPKLNPGGKTDHTALPYTILTVKIARVYKGTATEGGTITVKQLGGESGGTKYTEKDAEPLNVKSSYILFLSTFDNAPASLLNPTQGSYAVADGKIVANTNNPVPVDYQDLQRLKQRGK